MAIALPTNPSSAKASVERCHGQVDSFEHSNCTIQVHWSDDPDMGPPWAVHDGHGVVIEGSDAERLAGQLPVDRFRRLSPFDRNSYDRYYDIEASLVVARRDRWGLCPDALDELQSQRGRSLADDEIIEAAVQADFEHLHAWCHDQWRWLAADVIVDVRTREGSCFLRDISCLGGIESTGAGGEIEELVAPARDWIDANQERINRIGRSHELICFARRHLTEI